VPKEQQSVIRKRALAQFSYRNQIKTVQQVLEAVMEQIAVQSV